MKQRTYNILSKLPIYGTFLKYSSKGEVLLCSPMIADLSEEGISTNDIFKVLEKKYPGEVVTNERFWEGYRIIKSLQKKEMKKETSNACNNSSR